MVTFPIKLTAEQHKEVKIKAIEAGKSMHQYILDCLEKPLIIMEANDLGNKIDKKHNGIWGSKEPIYIDQGIECKHDFEPWNDLDDCYQRVCKICSEVFEKPKDTKSDGEVEAFVKKQDWCSACGMRFEKEARKSGDSVWCKCAEAVKPKKLDCDICHKEPLELLQVPNADESGYIHFCRDCQKNYKPKKPKEYQYIGSDGGVKIGTVPILKSAPIESASGGNILKIKNDN